MHKTFEVKMVKGYLCGEVAVDILAEGIVITDDEDDRHSVSLTWPQAYALADMLTKFTPEHVATVLELEPPKQQEQTNAW